MSASEGRLRLDDGTELPTLLERPRGARALLVLAHGAGAGMHHVFMQSLAEALAARKIATLRYAFPFTAGAARRRPDPPARLVEVVRVAVERGRASKLPLFAGGKSLGGRMTTTADASAPLDVRGIVLFGFPLQAPSATIAAAKKRSAHLAEVSAPLLFLQGTRDALAPLRRLRPIVAKLPEAAMVIVEGADHGFAVPKSTGRSSSDVVGALADAAAHFMIERA
jgi:predicted alpha/beta-hydrolase family hydrolase